MSQVTTNSWFVPTHIHSRHHRVHVVRGVITSQVLGNPSAHRFVFAYVNFNPSRLISAREASVSG